MRFLSRLRRSSASEIAVIPFWPRRPWFHDPTPAQPGGSPTTPADSGSTLPSSVLSSSSGETAPNGMEVERNRFLEQGSSQEVVSTLLQARKCMTNVTYDRIWEKFASMAQQNSWDPLSPEAPQVLKFMQAGLTRGLSSSTLEVQISALSAKTGFKWASHPLLIQFMKACIKISPPRRPTFPAWDLSVVLNALSNPPFHPADSISLRDLTLK